MLRNLVSQKCPYLPLSLLLPFAAANKKNRDGERVAAAADEDEEDEEEEEEHDNNPPPQQKQIDGHFEDAVTAMEIEAQLPPHHPRLPSACNRHPDQNVTGFCASCLRERLAGLESDRKSATSSSSSSSSALKTIFFKVAGGQPSSSSSSSSLLRPDLRRCKSFSGSRVDAYSGPRASAAFEPQRKSCDVRGRSTLWSLFNQADMNRVVGGQGQGLDPFLASGNGDIEIEIEPGNLGLGFIPSSVAAPVIEAREEDERDDNDEEIRPVDPGEIVEKHEDGIELKPMKDHIDLESQAKKPSPKEATGSFWLAASVFSNKLQNWRRKQKLKKSSSNAASTIQTEKTHKSSQRFRETQSEIAVDAFGRRSCDIDPRFSLDVGRMSIDDPRYSWDAPRASWDGHLIGVRSAFHRFPPMLAVGEDAHIPAVERWDSRIPVEEDSTIPGGSVQTRDYYLDSSSSRRRRSLDRSNSARRPSVELIEPKVVSNAKVSPAGGTEFFHLPNGIKLDRELRDFSSNSLRDDRSESLESTFRGSKSGAPKKKSRRWSKAWNIWGFIYRRGSSRGGAANEVERTFSETWPELREQVYNGKIFRSNSSVSRRSSIYNNSGFGSMRRSSVETNSHTKNKCGEFVLERNRSTRYSPRHVDNGLLRFYLTPMRSNGQNGMSGKNRHNTTCSIPRTVAGMY